MDGDITQGTVCEVSVMGWCGKEGEVNRKEDQEGRS